MMYVDRLRDTSYGLVLRREIWVGVFMPALRVNTTIPTDKAKIVGRRDHPTRVCGRQDASKGHLSLCARVSLTFVSVSLATQRN
uniref:Uncharacterized protein n=1 Tax=Halorubrum lacusprofundi TaxID=2247 RepID=A0A220SXN2_9EURY|nr:hypothetical protein [Halorubrum lacusprofundi]